MSLSDLTRNSFQSGLVAAKWGSLCRLLISNNYSRRNAEETQTDISNSVLRLFRDYPGDPSLQHYLKFAIQNDLLSLPIYAATFLSAARSPDLHHPPTLDMLCRIALDSHYASGLPPTGSLVSFSESTIEILGTVQDAMALLRLAHSMSMSHLHRLPTSASELLILLLSTVSDVSQISTAQAMVHLGDASDMLQVLRLAPDVRKVLDSFVLNLSALLGDDAKLAREAQMLHTIQLAMGKGDIMGPNSDSDTTTCCLVLHGLVSCRAEEFGAGDAGHVTAVLVALLRWSSWTRIVFYTQLLLSTVVCVAQSSIGSPSTRPSSVWRAFAIGRFPSILVAFQAAAETEGGTEVDWHTALQVALSHVLQRSDLLDQCDGRPQSVDSDSIGDKAGASRPFFLEFLHKFLVVGLIDPTFAATIHSTLANDFHPRLVSEAQDSGLELLPYYESRLSVENSSIEDTQALVQRTWREPCSHAAFAEAVGKQFSRSHPHDVETLGHICKILCQCERALDIVSLHKSISMLVAQALAFVEGYDCETVGDPQTAVIHLGDVILFIQSTIARFNLSCPAFVFGDKSYGSDFLRSASVIYKPDQIKGEDLSAFNAWFKALFDSNEGIEDTILRATRPQTLLRLTATLFARAIALCSEKRMEKDTLNSGVSYFLGPLLNWTLAGVVKTLASEIQQRAFHAPIHLEVLQILLLSSLCPRSVQCLSAPTILRLFRDPKKYENERLGQFDLASVRKVALDALGIPVEAIHQTQMAPHGTNWTHRPQQAIRDAYLAVRAGKGPCIDVNRCLLLTSPSKFLNLLWSEAVVAATTMGEMEASRRITTFVLTMPRCHRWPPLLPLFLHSILPGLVAAADHLPPSEQATTIELLVAIISSSLSFALHLEWALITVCGDKRQVLGPPATTMARRLSGDLRRQGHGSTSDMIVQRLTSSAPFMTNFPTFIADL